MSEKIRARLNRLILRRERARELVGIRALEFEDLDSQPRPAEEAERKRFRDVLLRTIQDVKDAIMARDNLISLAEDTATRLQWALDGEREAAAVAAAAPSS